MTMIKHPFTSVLHPLSRHIRAAGELDTSPTTDVLHALACGLLPTLERLVREAPAAVMGRGEAEEGAAAELLAACYFGRNDWDRLMPYAEPQQLGGLVAAAGGVLGRRVEALEAQQGGSSAWSAPFTRLFYAGTKAVCGAPYELVDVMRDAGFFGGNEARVLSYLDGRGPLVCYCARKACAQCRPGSTASGSGSGSGSNGGGSGSGSGGSGGSGSGNAQGAGQRARCPARRLAVNLSVTLFQLLPPMAKAVLWLERQGAGEEAVTAAYSMYEALVVLCLRVHWDRCQQERQQQQEQQGKPAGGVPASGAGAASPGSPAGTGGTSGKYIGGTGSAVAGCSTSGGGTSGSCSTGTGTAAAAPAPDGAQPPAAGSQEGQVHSWRELLLRLQPFRLLRLVLQEPRRCAREEPGGPWEAPIGTFLAGPGHLLWALALALPEELAAALAADPQLAERIGARATGGGAMEVDACVVEVLKQQLPGLPACKAVAALEGRCGLPVVSRAKRQAARERLGGLRALWARVHVLVDVGEVVGVLEGWEG